MVANSTTYAQVVQLQVKLRRRRADPLRQPCAGPPLAATAACLRLPDATATRASKTRNLRESLRVIKAATDVSGDVNKALFWYRNEPLSAFGFKTAETLVSAGRTEAVLKYVMSIEAGASG